MEAGSNQIFACNTSRWYSQRKVTIWQLQLTKYYFEKYVLEVAIAALEKGGSVSKLDTYKLLPPTEDWKFPKYPSKTVILSPQIDLEDELKNFIFVNEPFLREVDSWLGTWINPQTQQFYFDITTIRADLDEARKLAFELDNSEGRKIVAIYNSGRDEIIYLRMAHSLFARVILIE